MSSSNSLTPTIRVVGVQQNTNKDATNQQDTLLTRPQAMETFAGLQDRIVSVTGPRGSRIPGGFVTNCFRKSTDSLPAEDKAVAELFEPAKKELWTEYKETLVIDCARYIASNYAGESNLFAASASQAEVDGLKIPLPSSGVDPHVAAGVIKQEMRHVSHKLVSVAATKSYVSRQIEVASNFESTYVKAVAEELKDVFSPRRSLVFLELMSCLAKVTRTNMTPANLARCIAPPLCEMNENPREYVVEIGRVALMAERLILEAFKHESALERMIEEIAEQSEKEADESNLK